MSDLGQSDFNDQPEEGSRHHIEIPEKGKIMTYVKNFFLFLLLVALIVGSFWISFHLGKRILAPVKKEPAKKLEIAIPEPPPSIAGFQSFEELEESEEIIEVSKVEEKKPAVKPKKVYTAPSPVGPYYKVQAGFFNEKSNALRLSNQLKAKGIDTFIRKIGNGYRVQAGAYDRKAMAKIQQDALKKKGFDSIIIYE
ncbi:MAG: SPOR domain-containing protein [Candidatus Margulisiibacteriota bacterium]|nr:SPOR domain-containing protein [Candidatus Margulisiibacteriota bacterium]